MLGAESASKSKGVPPGLLVSSMVWGIGASYIPIAIAM